MLPTVTQTQVALNAIRTFVDNLRLACTPACATCTVCVRDGFWSVDSCLPYGRRTAANRSWKWVESGRIRITHGGRQNGRHANLLMEIGRMVRAGRQTRWARSIDDVADVREGNVIESCCRVSSACEFRRCRRCRRCWFVVYSTSSVCLCF